MNTNLVRTALAAVCAFVANGAHAQSLPAGVTAKEVSFYSEAVSCHGKLFLPNGYSDSSKAAAVVLAPGANQTAATVESYAAALAGKGVVAMAIDYRGFGKSGGFLYVGEPVMHDDRLRFNQSTTKLRIRRQRLDPRAQVIDIRNAMTYLQGEAGIDRARIGVWGVDLGGGHAITVAGSDARAKAVVAQTPVIAGKDLPRAAFAPNAEQQALLVKLARTEAPATASAAKKMNEDELKLAMAEYRPFHYLDVIPQTTSVLFVTAEKDSVVDNESNAIAAAKVVKGNKEVKVIPGSTHAMSGDAGTQAAQAAAEWFAKNL